MREILFRGKRLDNGDWVIGFLTMMWYQYHIVSYENKNTAYCVDPETIGQFTGLTDKNVTKIFEGDILKQKTTTKFAEVSPFEWERYGVVRFGYHDWGDKNEAGYASEGWYIEPLRSVSVKPKNYGVGYIQSGLNQCDILDEYYPMEVIGNIYDNPELLGGGADNG